VQLFATTRPSDVSTKSHSRSRQKEMNQNRILTSLLTIAAVWSSSNMANGQTPGPPTSQIRESIRIIADVLESDGTASQGPLRLQLTFPSTAPSTVVRYTSSATSSAPGHFIFDFFVDPSHPTSHNGVIELWPSTGTGSPSRAEQFHLDPAQGRAAFLKAIKIPRTSVIGPFAVSVRAVMSAPPVYGHITVNGGVPAGSSVSVVDRDMEFPEASVRRARKLALHQALPLTASFLPIYRWSMSGLADANIKGSLGGSVAVGILRRGGHLTLTPKVELQLNLQVSEAIWPTANQVLLVRPEDHQPNPNVPTGSNIPFLDQRKRQLVSSMVVFENGTSSRVMTHFTGSYVAELWGMTVAPDGSVERQLIAASQVSPVATNVTVAF
jgi:hypothetical protein